MLFFVLMFLFLWCFSATIQKSFSSSKERPCFFKGKESVVSGGFLPIDCPRVK